MTKGVKVGVCSLLIAASALLTAGAGDGDPNLLYWPESVVFDAPRDRYIVSNWATAT